jgi:hypothetical protein
MKAIRRFMARFRDPNKARRIMLTLDPSAFTTVSGHSDGRLQISGTDYDSGRPFTLTIPSAKWPSITRAMAARLAFRVKEERRERERANKTDAGSYSAGY